MSDVYRYKCPSCGSTLEFDSQTQKMKCPYCDCEIDVEALKLYEDLLNSEVEEEDKTNWRDQFTNYTEEEFKDLAVYLCKSCGGEIIVDKTTGATSCPYCDNPVVIPSVFKDDLKPDYVIPFKLDKKAAKKEFEKHLLNKPLLPSVFKSDNHINEIKGVYVPFWVFDAETKGQGLYTATRRRVWRDSKYEYVETSFYQIIRDGSMSFSKLPVDASVKMDDALMESLEPFDFKEAVDFKTAYLSGYLADRYDVNLEDCKTRAVRRLKYSTTHALDQSVVGYSTVEKQKGSTTVEEGEVSYVLYPVWILNTTWHGENYQFAMNGQTGKFVGDLPVDKTLYWSKFAKTAAIFAAIGAVISLIF